MKTNFFWQSFSQILIFFLFRLSMFDQWVNVVFLSYRTLNFDHVIFWTLLGWDFLPKWPQEKRPWLICFLIFFAEGLTWLSTTFPIWNKNRKKHENRPTLVDGKKENCTQFTVALTSYRHAYIQRHTYRHTYMYKAIHSSTPKKTIWVKNNFNINIHKLISQPTAEWLFDIHQEQP